MNKYALAGQRWINQIQVGPGIESGNMWTFLAHNRFTEKEWYSGGAYFTRHYAGTYYYDDQNKTVFIQYDRDKTPTAAKGRKRRLIVHTNKSTKNLSVIDGWDRKISAVEVVGLPQFRVGKRSFTIEWARLNSAKQK